MTTVSELPAVMFVDGQYAEVAPVATQSSLLQLRVKILNADENGFPGEVEQVQLDELEEQLIALIDANYSGVYVGRVTLGGSRIFYAYAATGLGFETHITAAMKEFEDYEWSVDVEEDAEWSCYVESLLPDKYDVQTMKNQQVIQELMEHGDQLETPREVLHWAYFPDTDSRQAFIDRVKEGGMEVDGLTEPDEEADAYGVTVKLDHALDGEFLDDLTCGLLDIAEEHGGEYDGWESPVVSE